MNAEPAAAWNRKACASGGAPFSIQNRPPSRMVAAYSDRPAFRLVFAGQSMIILNAPAWFVVSKPYPTIDFFVSSIMRHRLTVVLSRAQGKQPAKKALQESIVAALSMEQGLDVSVVQYANHLTPDHSSLLFLESV